jgi:DNA-binding transcriptional MerR regulator
MSSNQLKVGELARVTRLTVRTLHHYDEIGLLRPSDRTYSGYRLYSPEDVRRLYRIVALRGLGLGLEEIGEALDREGSGAREAVQRHLDELEQELRAKTDLRDRLARILAGLDRVDEPATTDYIDAIERMTMIERHYTPEALAKLEERATAYGPEQMQKVQDDWAELIAAMTAEIKKGTDPADPEPQRLGARWRELLTLFTGGDPEIKEGLNSLYREEGAEVASRGAMDAELMAYVGRVHEAVGEGA